MEVDEMGLLPVQQSINSQQQPEQPNQPQHQQQSIEEATQSCRSLGRWDSDSQPLVRRGLWAAVPADQKRSSDVGAPSSSNSASLPKTTSFFGPCATLDSSNSSTSTSNKRRMLDDEPIWGSISDAQHHQTMPSSFPASSQSLSQSLSTRSEERDKLQQQPHLQPSPPSHNNFLSSATSTPTSLSIVAVAGASTRSDIATRTGDSCNSLSATTLTTLQPVQHGSISEPPKARVYRQLKPHMEVGEVALLPLQQRLWNQRGPPLMFPYVPVVDPTYHLRYMMCNFCQSDRVHRKVQTLVKHVECGECPVGLTEMTRLKEEINMSGMLQIGDSAKQPPLNRPPASLSRPQRAASGGRSPLGGGVSGDSQDGGRRTAAWLGGHQHQQSGPQAGMTNCGSGRLSFQRPLAKATSAMVATTTAATSAAPTIESDAKSAPAQAQALAEEMVGRFPDGSSPSLAALLRIAEDIALFTLADCRSPFNPLLFFAGSHGGQAQSMKSDVMTGEVAATHLPRSKRLRLSPLSSFSFSNFTILDDD